MDNWPQACKQATLSVSGRQATWQHCQRPASCSKPSLPPRAHRPWELQRLECFTEYFDDVFSCECATAEQQQPMEPLKHCFTQWLAPAAAAAAKAAVAAVVAASMTILSVG